MKREILTIIFLSLLALPAVAENMRVRAVVDSKTDIFLGDQIALYIVIDGALQAGDVDTAPLSEFYPEYAGGSQRSSSSYEEINGQIVQKIDKKYIMTYRLSASKAGQIRIPSLNVTVEGKEYATNPLRINVIEPQESDKMDIALTFAKTKCYKGEPVEIDLRWFIHDSVSGAVEGVNFVMPLLKGEDFFIEKVNEVEYRANPKKFIGLKVNGQTLPFTKRTVVRDDGEKWIQLGYKAIVVPKRSGKIEVPSAMVFADLAIGRVIKQGFYGTKRQAIRFAESTKPLTIEVSPLPPFNGDNAFGGLVGKYTIRTEATPVKVDVGQPINLTIKVGGSRFLRPVQWPELENVEDISNNFKVSTQREDPVIADGQKIFKTVIRASTDKIEEIPAIPLLFFDTDKGEYITAKSDPIPIDVAPSDVVTLDDAEIHGSTSTNRNVEAVKKGMAANIENIQLVTQAFSPTAALIKPAYLPIWSVPFIAFLMSTVIRTLTNTSEEKQAASRRRTARKHALKMIKSAATKQDVVSAMREYIGWRFGKQSGAITAIDSYRLIEENCNDEHIAEEYRKIFEDCEAAYYTGGANTDPAQNKKIIELINKIDKKSRR